MHKKLLSMLLLLCCAGTTFAQEQRPQLQVLDWEQSGDNVNKNQGISFLETQQFNGKWPKVDGKDCAWIRVKFQNMPADEILSLQYNFGNVVGLPSQTIDRLNTDDHEIWLIVKPAEEAYMEVSSPKYGTSNRLSNIKIEPKSAYNVTVKNDKTVTVNIKTIPEEGVYIAFDGKAGHTSPCNITDVPLGRHHIVVSLKGKQVKDEWVEVSETNTLFDYDLRKTYTVRIESDPSGAEILLDGKPQGRTPKAITIEEGSHQIETKIDDDHTDVQNFTINDANQRDFAVIKTKPVKNKTFVAVPLYDGKQIEANLYVDGTPQSERAQQSFTLTYPIGSKHHFNMEYMGKHSERDIKITENMSENQEFKITAYSYTQKFWERSYTKAPVGWDFHYVMKNYVIRDPDTKKTYKTNVWGDESYHHGFQTGIRVQPTFSWGLGFYTGLYYEFYYCKSQEPYDGLYYRLTEHNLYIPAHALYIFPLGQKTAIQINGGIGMDIGLTNTVSVTEEGYETESGVYGDGFPKRFNLSAEVGLSARFNKVQINAQYSFGLINHEFIDGYKTSQRKLTVGVGFVFGE